MANDQDVGNRQLDLSPVLDAIQELRNEARAWPAADGPADLAPVVQALQRIEQLASRPSVDLRPVLDAVADLRGWPVEEPPTVDLSPVTNAIDELLERTRRLEEVATEPVDLSDDFDPVTTEVRALQTSVAELRSRIDDLVARPAPKIDEGMLATALREQLGWVSEALADIRRLSGRAADAVPVVDAMRSQLEATDLTPLLTAAGELRDATRTADLESVVAALNALQREMRPVDVTPLMDALSVMRAELPGIVDPAPLARRIEGRIDALEAGLSERDRRAAVDFDRLVRIDEVLPRVADALGELPSRLASLTSGVDQAVIRADALAPLVASIKAAVEAVHHDVALDRTATDALERTIGNLETTMTAMRTAFGDMRVGVERLSAAVADRRADDSASGALPAVVHEPVDLAPVERSISDLAARVGTVAEIQAALERLAATPPGSVDLSPFDKLLTALAGDLEHTRQRMADIDRKVEVAAGTKTAVEHLERRVELELDDLGRKLDALATVVRMAMTTTASGPADDAARARAQQNVSERLHHYRELAAGAADAVRGEVRKRRRTN
jgi:hypothetical protein